MVKPVTLNVERGLYVIPCGDGYTCFGFENCFRDVVDLCQKLGRDVPADSMKGTLECYALHGTLVSEFARSPKSQRTWFTPGTDPKVSEILERYRKNDGLLRIFNGDPTTGEDWCSENDVVGLVGRSTGVMKVPLLLTPGEHWGDAISTNGIVRIMDANSNKELYRCKNYQVPNLRLAANVDPALAQYLWVGYRDDTLIARFETMYEAAEWLDFLIGRKAAKTEHFQAAYGAYRKAA